MAITQNTYTGNGSTVLYSFAFPYLNTADVKVSINGTITTAYTFANATTIQFNTAPANGAAIRIYRETNDASLQAVLSPGSSIRASDLNDNFDQLIYLGQEANTEADSATATANTALTNSATAISTANTASTNASAAVSTANTASANASAAVTTANTASTNASAAVSTANTASTNATTALNTANAATTTANNAVTSANNAVSTANTALTNANAAVSTANTASTNATNAVNTANTANSNANTAVTTANNAVTTANSAVNTANSAVSTANSAVTTANAAAAAVANAVLYTTVANVAAIPGSPSNNDAVEVTDSTGIESFTPLSGLPGGFVGSSGLAVRLIYQSVGSTWTWIQYFPNDPEARYLKFSGGTLTGQLRGDDSASASTPGFAFDGDANTGMGRPGADELALITGGSARLTIDPAGAVSIPGTLGVTGAITGSLTGSASNNVLKAGDTMTGALGVTAGTAGAPSVFISGDTNTGLYSPGADQVAISTGGSGRLFVDANGNIGVGTSSANISGGAAGTSALTLKATTSLRNSIIELIGTRGGADQVSSYIRSFSNAATSPGVDLQFWRGTTDTDGYLSIHTSGSERMRISQSGLVGVGTSNVLSNVQIVVDSAVADNGSIFTLASGGGNTVNKLNMGVSSVNNYAWIQSTKPGTDVLPLLLNPGGGRVGIGTSSPETSLHVSGITRVTSGADGGAYQLRYSGANASSRTWRLINDANAYGDLDIQQSTTQTGSTFASRLYINASGQVGIGTTSPATLLDLSSTTSAKLNLTYPGFGIATIASDSTGALLLQADEANTQASSLIQFKVDGSERARIDSSGRLLVGTSSTSAAARVLVSGGDGARGVLNIAGTSATPADGDDLGFISFNDSSHIYNNALIRAQRDGGTWTATTSKPTRLVFSTTADGASSPTERLRIANNGAWGLAGANYGSSGQALVSNGSGSAPTWQSVGAGLGSTTQTWTNVLSSRTNGTTYTNSTGLPIMLSFAGTDLPNQGLNFTFQVQGSNVGVALTNVAPGYNMIVGVYVVPNGHTYRAAWNGAANLAQWWELR